MSALELRAARSLSSLFALRMLGLILIVPVFDVHTQTLPGRDVVPVGWALGVYGLTQGLLQIPFGMASDRIGRKPVIIFGRAIQGTGAILAAVTAYLSALRHRRDGARRWASTIRPRHWA